MLRHRDVASLRKIVQVLRPFAHGERGRLLCGILLGVAAVGLHVLQPWPLKWILDALSGTFTGPFASWLASNPRTAVPAMAVLFVCVALAAAAADYGQILALNGVGNRVLYRFRAQLFSHVLDQPLAFHESREVGELLTRVVFDTARLRRGLNSLLTRLFRTIALFAATTTVLFVLDPALGIIMAVGGSIALATMRRRGNRIARAAGKQRRREGSLAALVANELMTVRESQTFGASEDHLRNRFAGRNDRSLKQEQKVRRLAAGLSLRVEGLLATSVALALWWGTQRVLQGRLTAGDLVIFFSYAISLRMPFIQFARQTAQIGRTRACGERLLKISNRSARIQDAPDATDAPELHGTLAFDDVSLKTPRRTRTGRKWAVRHADVQLPAGTRVAVVGANGAGKSTLLRLVLRLADPASGRVTIDGYDLRTQTLRSIRDQMSVVFQDSVLSGLTVRDNIALGMPDATAASIMQAASKALASEFIEGLPQRYDTVVRRGGMLFSGGERQRIAVARALLRDGRLWLLDEPTAGLDHATASTLTDTLVAATEGRTTLWITHDPALMPRLEWTIALDGGRMTYCGPSNHFDPHAALPSQPRSRTEPLTSGKI